jgi:uncharacterized protein (DUF608 family)
LQLGKQIGYSPLLVSLASNSSLPLGIFLWSDAVPVGDEFTRSVPVPVQMVRGGRAMGRVQQLAARLLSTRLPVV